MYVRMYVCMYVGLRTEDAYLYRHMKGYRLKCLGSSYSQHTNVACCYRIILVHSKGVFGPQSGCASEQHKSQHFKRSSGATVSVGT